MKRGIVHVGVRLLWQSGLTFEKSKPPTRRIHRAIAVVCGRVDIVEEVPNCDDVSDSLWHVTVGIVNLL